MQRLSVPGDEGHDVRITDVCATVDGAVLSWGITVDGMGVGWLRQYRDGSFDVTPCSAPAERLMVLHRLVHAVRIGQLRLPNQRELQKTTF